ncbi:MAG: hypothetical protein CNCCGFBP_02042 [Fimbriimonadaceae bacterium]|nr:hypothetical protein [Fimbriimonadaceae bacterium]
MTLPYTPAYRIACWTSGRPKAKAALFIAVSITFSWVGTSDAAVSKVSTASFLALRASMILASHLSSPIWRARSAARTFLPIRLVALAMASRRALCASSREEIAPSRAARHVFLAEDQSAPTAAALQRADSLFPSTIDF